MVFYHVDRERIPFDMKKAVLTGFSMIVAVLLIGANVHDTANPSQQHKKSSGCGYRIVEYGIGVNCNGDTIRLVKARGFQALATE